MVGWLQWREDATRSLREELSEAEAVGGGLSDDLGALLTSTETGKKRDPYTGNARARKDGIVQKKCVRACVRLPLLPMLSSMGLRRQPCWTCRVQTRGPKATGERGWTPV